MNTDKLRQLAQMHVEFADEADYGPHDLTREFAALAIDAANELTESTDVAVTIPDDVRGAIQEALGSDLHFYEHTFNKDLHVDKINAIKAAQVWLDQQGGTDGS